MVATSVIINSIPLSSIMFLKVPVLYPEHFQWSVERQCQLGDRICKIYCRLIPNRSSDR